MAHVTDETSGPGSQAEPFDRLESWKEVASHLNRDVRTVQRWEKSEGLPVHRHLHDKGGTVYAYRSELDAWREHRAPHSEQHGPIPRGSRLRWLWWAVGAAALLAIVAGVLIVGVPHLASRVSDVPVVLRSVQLTTSGLKKFPALVPHGSRLYFSESLGGRWRISAVPVDGGHTIPVPTSLLDPAVEDVSPDGTELLVSDRPEGALAYPFYLVPVAGGAPRRIRNVVGHCAALFPDGRRIVYVNGPDILVANRDGSDNRKLTTTPGIPWYCRVSPDGSVIRFSLQNLRSNSVSLWEVSADGSNLQPLLAGWSDRPDDCCGSWTADGAYYFFQSGRGGTQNIWAIRERSGRWRKNEKEPVRLTTGPMQTGSPVPGRDKRVFVIGTMAGSRLFRYDSVSKQFTAYLSGVSGSMLEFSRDGRWVTYVSVPEQTLWRAKADGTERLQLTEPPMEVMLPRWSPDGRRIAFQGRTPGGPWKVYLVPLEGGNPRPLPPGEADQADPTWGPEGKSLVFGGTSDGKPSEDRAIHVVDLDTLEVSTLPGSEGLFSPRWSPDGRHVAALSGDWQRLLLFDVRSREWVTLAQMHVGFPNWSRDGTYLYFQSLQQEAEYVIYRVRISGRKLERVGTRMGIPLSFTAAGLWLGLAPDDSPVIMGDTTTAEIFALDYAFPSDGNRNVERADVKLPTKKAQVPENRP